jgi:murein L,D-transpeptidase YcbB/YkuD
MGIKLILISCLLLQGCATMIASNMGASATVVATAETVDQIKTAADVVSYGTTHKTLTDHALDAVTGRDCNLINVFDKYHKICKERMPDLSTKEKIKEFQRSKGIEPTGTIGPKTRIAVWRIKNELD